MPASTSRARSTQVGAPETLASAASDMTSTLKSFRETLTLLSSQAGKVSTLGPNIDGCTAAIQKLSHDVDQNKIWQERSINSVKDFIENQLPEQTFRSMKSDIQKNIKHQISLQVKQEVDNHIEEYMPDKILEKQLQETEKQVDVVNSALENSKARRKNSVMPSSNLHDDLAVVRNTKGVRSKFWPVDLASLFAYDGPTSTKLIQDFGLIDAQVREENLNRFMEHICIELRLVKTQGQNAYTLTKVDK